MIDKRAKLAELQTALGKAQQTLTDTTVYVHTLNGGIMMLQELLADEDADAAPKETGQ